MPNSKPCNMRYNNEGILQTFFNLARIEQATDTTPVHFHALLLCYYFLPTQTPSICLSFLSICPLLSMFTPFDVFATIHHSFTLSHSILLLHRLFSFLAFICMLTPPSCVPACLCRHILCLIVNVMTMQLLKQAFPQTKLATWVIHITAFSFLLPSCMTCMFRREKTTRNEWAAKVAVRL